MASNDNCSADRSRSPDMESARTEPRDGESKVASAVSAAPGSVGEDCRYVIPSSMRPDGTMREARRVRPGYVPAAEAGPYVPPAARKKMALPPLVSVDDGGESWADDEAPVLVAQRTPEKANVSVTKSGCRDTEVPSPVAAEPQSGSVSMSHRLPSQLATAIDDALDVLSLGTSSSDLASVGEARPMGRFAAEIARDAAAFPSSLPAKQRSEEHGRDAGGMDKRRLESCKTTGAAQKTTAASTSAAPRPAMTSVSALTGECPRLNDCVQELSKLRREIAILNAKLEYIRFMKNRDPRELTGTERERVALEDQLISRMNAIYDRADEMDRRLHEGK